MVDFCYSIPEAKHVDRDELHDYIHTCAEKSIEKMEKVRQVRICPTSNINPEAPLAK